MFKKATTLCVSLMLLSCFPTVSAFADEQETLAQPIAKVTITKSQQQGAGGSKTVMVSAGTRVPITIYNTVNSNNLKDGDMIGISINKDLVIDGQTIFKKGTDGVLFVAESKKSGGHGKAGRLEINGGRITDVYGNDHPINLSVSTKGESKRGGAILASVLGVALILIPFGLWVDGKPATLQGGSQYDAMITSPSEVAIANKGISL